MTCSTRRDFSGLLPLPRIVRGLASSKQVAATLEEALGLLTVRRI